MSRAFVKETDARTEELPDRPISSHRNFVTETGLAAIEASIGRFEAAHQAAADKGDVQAAAAALREVRYWRTRRASAEVVRRSSDTRTASFGMTVALRREDGREQTFRIVGEDEADQLHGMGRFPTSRPRPCRPDLWARRYGRDCRRDGCHTGRPVELFCLEGGGERNAECLCGSTPQGRA